MIKCLKVKQIFCIFLIVVYITIFQGCTSIQKNGINNIQDNLSGLEMISKNEDNIRTLDYDEIKNSVIRFHVIANSDSVEDQNLKLKVKNKVIDYLYPYLSSSGSLDESREIIKSKMKEVKRIAEEIIKDNRYEYSIKVELSKENFPDKSYGNILLPQGEYEAFRIIIGDGQGKNWWCVMFPPLCFVDETKAEVEYDNLQNKIDLEQKELDAQEADNSNESKIDNLDESDQTNKYNNDDIKIELKIIEVLKNLFN